MSETLIAVCSHCAATTPVTEKAIGRVLTCGSCQQSYEVTTVKFTSTEEQFPSGGSSEDLLEPPQNPGNAPDRGAPRTGPRSSAAEVRREDGQESNGKQAAASDSKSAGGKSSHKSSSKPDRASERAKGQSSRQRHCLCR